MSLSLSTALRSTVAASVLLFVAGSASAKAAAPSESTRTTPAAATTLKHLPAGPDELVFRGENTAKRWSLYLSRTEAARATGFQLAMQNAVSVLPDRSSLKLSINGRVLSVQTVHSSDQPSIMLVKVPAGLLVPGVNRVEMNMALTHRVDCSINATYELWALLDPDRTGLAMDTGALNGLRSLDDLAAEPLAGDGTTRIHLRVPADADTATIERGSILINALVQRASLFRPVVDIGPEPGTGAGFDVVFANVSALDTATTSPRLLGREGDITLVRDTTTGRLTLVFATGGDADFDQKIAAVLHTQPTTGAAPVADGRNLVRSDSSLSFAELGLSTEPFLGRHYVSSTDVTFPSDFYPANYDKARILISGTHSNQLDPSSELIIRVNGTIVSTLRLAAGMPEVFKDQMIELPLRFFHPGHNELAIEGVLTTASDQQCDLTTMSRDTRLTIAGTSRLEIPNFARLATLPQIPEALASSATDVKGLNVYLPDGTRGAIGSALTVLANLAVTERRLPQPRLVFANAEPNDAPGIVIAPLDQLPLHLLARLPELSFASADATGDVPPVRTDIAPSPVARATGASATAFGSTVSNVVNVGASVLRDRGFFFAQGMSGESGLALTPDSLVIGAAQPNIEERTIAGVELPTFTRVAAQWLVITGRTAVAYQAGVGSFVANGHWNDLSGQAISFDAASGQLRALQPQRVTYVLPQDFVPSDVRPILGGIVSNNITLSVVVLMALMSLLGLSTHLLVRRIGAK